MFVRFDRVLLAVCLLFVTLVPARAVESVRVPLDSQAIDLTRAVESYSSQGDRLQVSTAPGSDGIVRRIEVRAKEEGAHPSWIVFALTNDTDEQIERLLVAPHFRLVGSGTIWPDLGAIRIAAITASQGFPPEREESADSDVFRVTLDPGTTVTYVAELRTPNLPQLYLWDPDAYKDRLTNLTLYKGIVIGISGLLALFLTIVVVVKGAVIFPAAAALAWAVLAYVCIDFGFWSKIFGVSADNDRLWRAASETILSATLVVFLFAYLNLNRWHVRASHVVVLWVVFLLALVGLAVYDAPVAAGVAHISLATVAGAGFVLVLYFATHGYDRAVMLIPTWFLLLVWVMAAGFAVSGAINNDIVGPTLIGGLVLIVMLIGFTVMQNAFASGGLAAGAISDVERKALAVTGANDVIFDWDVPSDHIYVSPEVEAHPGLERGDLEGPASGWLEILHPFERDRYRACLDTLLEQRRGRINEEFRLRASDGHYLWYRLRCRPVVGADGEVVRIVGTLVDVTDERAVDLAIRQVESRLPAIVALANLAGVSSPTPFLELTSAEWRRILDVNLTGTFLVTRRVMPGMVERRLGRVVSVSSISAQRGGGTYSKVAYSAAKAGIIGLTRALAREVGEFGVTVNCVAPGPIDTDIMGGPLSAQRKEAMTVGMPVGRVGTPEEVAALLAFLCGPDAGYITAATYDINGGLQVS